jgi:hypothetical protein
MKKQTLPKGWTEERVNKVIAHYRGQSEEVAEMEDEAAYRKRKATFMGIPVALVPLVRRLLAKCAAV